MAGVRANRAPAPQINSHPYICGGFAAVVAEMITFPLDTAKTRQQLQGQESVGRVWGNGNVRYRGTAHTISTIIRQEGVASIYRGLSPALVRQAVYGTIKFGLYYSSKDLAMRLMNQPQQTENSFVNLCCAVVAASVASVIANPTDVIKVRMQSGQRVRSHSGTMLSVGRNICSEEGITGLWRGVCPTAKRAVVVAGVQLPVYDWTKSRLLSTGVKDGPACHLFSSILAGLSACLASNPVDVVRTRMMVQKKIYQMNIDGATRIYHTSAVRCGMDMVQTEGVGSLYKGFFPAFARMGPWNVIFFVVYEWAKTSFPYIGTG